MHTLEQAADLQSILERLGRLRSDARPLWGRMTAGEMVCHLIDSYHVITGDKQVSTASNWLTRTLIKNLALWAPMEWPKGYATRPEIDQSLGNGTRATDFDEDRARLCQLIQQVVQRPASASWAPHPGFGPLTTREVMRWGYLHADHHLRQFGV